MNTDPVTVKRIEWLRIFPVLHLWHAARMAFCVRTLIPMFFAFVLAWVGAYQICQSTNSVPLDENTSDAALNPTTHVLQVFPWRSVQPPRRFHEVSLRPDVQIFTTGYFPAPVQACVVSLMSLLTSSDHILRDAAVLTLIAALLMLFGVAVARSTATEFCTQTRTGAVASIKLAIVDLPKSLLSTVLATVLIAIPVLLLNAAAWLAVMPGLGESVAMIAWPVITLLAVFASLTAVVVTTAWFLSLAAIGTDRCTGSDALSRGVNYVLSHKLQTVGYVSTVSIISKLAWWLVYVVQINANALLEPRFRKFIPIARREPRADVNGPEAALQWWQSAINIAPEVVEFGAFVSGLTLIYILLRQKEDGVQLRELDGGRR